MLPHGCGTASCISALTNPPPAAADCRPPFKSSSTSCSSDITSQPSCFDNTRERQGTVSASRDSPLHPVPSPVGTFWLVVDDATQLKVPQASLHPGPGLPLTDRNNLSQGNLNFTVFIGCHNLTFLLSILFLRLTLFHSKSHSNEIGHQVCNILNCLQQKM